MISQTAEYALRAVVFLADHPNSASTVTQIAEATRVPAGYLAKVMQSLSRAGVVRSQRGLNGGFTLARDAAELTVLEVVNVVDPVRRYPECPLGLPNHGKQLCPLHRRLDDAARALEDAVGRTKWADLLEVPKSRRPLCAAPPAAAAKR